jgi:hypothetical protein
LTETALSDRIDESLDELMNFCLLSAGISCPMVNDVFKRPPDLVILTSLTSMHRICPREPAAGFPAGGSLKQSPKPSIPDVYIGNLPKFVALKKAAFRTGFSESAFRRRRRP